MGPTGGDPDQDRVLVEPGQARPALLRMAGHDVGRDAEQHQQMAEVGAEVRDLIGGDDDHPVGLAEVGDGGVEHAARQAAGGLLDGEVVGGDRGLAGALVETEQRVRLSPGATSLDPTAVLVACRVLKVGKAVESERLTEPDDRRARRVGAARELLGGLEGDLVEVVDDVLRNVLLGA